VRERTDDPASRRQPEPTGDETSRTSEAQKPARERSGPRAFDVTAELADGPRLEGPEVGDELQARYRYKLVHRLGRGGFGSVFLGHCLDAHPEDDHAPPEQVAIKVLPDAGDGHAASSLKRELSALLAIRHERIPKLFDWTLDGDTPFSAIEYFPAGSVADAWPFLRRLDVDQTWRLITDLLQALAAAHRSSILHLDVKPSNVLLDGNGGYVLTDFGVSHASRMSRGLLHQGQLPIGLGTHGYRAPEQASATIQSFDLRTDLWGVGATAWALYTGIDLNKRQDVLRNTAEGNVYGLRRLSDVALDCPPPVVAGVMSLLFIDPSRRPGGAMEVLSQVKAIASGFGLESATLIAARRANPDQAAFRQVVAALVDPLWASICRSPGFEQYFVTYESGELISQRGEASQHTVLLLKGEVEIEMNDQVVAVEDREGIFIGAISTLTGAPRLANLRAKGPVYCCLFNEAELKQLVTCNPSVAVRMIRTMADRIVDGPPRHPE